MSITKIDTAISAIKDAVQSEDRFPFPVFNALTNDLPAGMQLALAEGLLKSALNTLERYNNPLEADLYKLRSDLKTFRGHYKADREEAKQRSADRERTNQAARVADQSIDPAHAGAAHSRFNPSSALDGGPISTI